MIGIDKIGKAGPSRIGIHSPGTPPDFCDKAQNKAASLVLYYEQGPTEIEYYLENY
jgi:hypothetical protein